MTRRLLAIAALVLVAAACSAAPSRSSASGTTPETAPGGHSSPAPAPAPNGETVFTPIVAHVLAPPIPVPATDGRIHLAYELVITNAVSTPITLDAIRAEADGRTLQELSGPALSGALRVFGTTPPTTVFGPGQSGLAWLDVTVTSEADIPHAIDHELDITAAEPNPPLLPATLTETVARTTVPDEDPVVIEPPLQGPRWVDGNSCCAVTAHRAAVSPLNGALWAPERYAIDYVQLDEQNRLFNGDRTALESYAFFGAPIVAVAPGRVVAVVDDLPEQTPGANPTGLPVEEYGGNHVVQDIGDGRYAFYAHLQTGSTRVKVGDELTTGQIVGLLGNSGNTDVPHLHFHVMDGPDPLASNGLPFVFSSFTLTGRLDGDDAVDELTASSAPARFVAGVTSTVEQDVMPLYLDVMDDAGP